MPLTPDNWRRVKEVVSDALEFAPEARRDFVASQCADEPELLLEIESLLAADDPRTSDLESDLLPSFQNIGPLVKGRYAVQKKLEQGGFSTTYLAVDSQLNDRRVVIKVMDSLNREPYLVRKFQEELAALSCLEHPNIIAPLDSGQLSDGSQFIVMQFAEGKTLRMILADGLVPLPRAANILLQLGRTLSFIHARKIYHRDLKPENVIVQTFADGNDHVRLIDFGIASIVDETTSTTTRVIGTLNYMAPEQLSGEVSAASDLYSLGVLAYELTTGSRPFNSASPVELVHMQRNGPRTRPRQIRPEVDPAAETLILKALQFQPSRRPPDVAHFAESLSRALQAHPGPVRSKSAAKMWYALASAVALVAVGGSLWFTRTHAPGSHALPAPAHLLAGPGRTVQSNTITIRLTRQRTQLPPGSSPDGTIQLNRNDEFRLEVTTETSGHLYIFSGVDNRATPPHILFPSPSAQSGSSTISAGVPTQIPDKTWFWFGPHAGYETLLLVWSPAERPDLESAVRWANPTNRGRLGPSPTLDAVNDLFSRAAPAAWKSDHWSFQSDGPASPYRLRIFHS